MFRLKNYFKPYSAMFIAAMFCVVLRAVSELMLPTYLGDIINKGIATGDTQAIFKYGWRMMIFVVTSAGGSIVSGFMFSKISAGLARDLRNGIFTKIESFSLSDIDKFGTASLITRTTNDISQVQNVVNMLRMMLFAPIMLIGSLVMAIVTSLRLSAVLAVAVPVLLIIILLIGRVSTKIYKSLQVKIDKLNQLLRENLTGIRVIRAFCTTEHEQKRFDDANSDLAATQRKVQRIMGTMMPLLNIVLNAVTVAVLWFGAKLVGAGVDGLEAGNLVSYNQYVTHVMMSMMFFSMMFVMLPRANVSAHRVADVLEQTPEITDPEESAQAKGRASVEFKNVSFAYPGAEDEVLKNVSFTSNEGETTAIIGSTGSGKSTVINLIPRFYDVTEGEILVDGVDVRKYSQHDLRDKIGYVPQKGVLFSGTIADNLRYAKPDAEEAELRCAAEVAQAIEFIDKKPEGLDSHIAQGGTNVSGGQKQRLSIARAIAKRPEIYIFDDSFSALDFKTDLALRTALKKETKNATVIIVAQRVSTIMDADRIVVLDQGCVAGVGTHKELMDTCEVYREIVSSQLTEEELA